MQVMPSRGYGGAEMLFDRFVKAVSLSGINQHLVMRNKAPYDFSKNHHIETSYLPFLNKYDIYSKNKIAKTACSIEPNIVLSWLRRGNQMTRDNKQANSIYIGRLDGYYKMHDFMHNDYLIAHTPSIKQHIISSGFPEERVEIIPNFLDKPLPASTLPLIKKPNNKTLLVCWGRFIKKKGFETVIKALVDNNDYHLWLIGNGEEKNNLLTLASQLNVKDRVELIVWQDDVSPFLYAADILVVPSLHEPFGNVIIEAWAHKKPLICSDSEGPSWLVSDESDGLVFQKGSHESLSQKLKTASLNPAILTSLANQGYQTFINNYSTEAVIPLYLSWFDRLLSTH